MNNDSTTYIDSLIQDYLFDEIDERSFDELFRWVESSSENRSYFMNICELYIAGGIEGIASRYDADKAYLRFSQNRFSKTKKQYMFKTSWAVGSLVAAAMIAFVVFFSFREGQQNVKNVFNDISIEVPKGSVSRLELPDGTHVLLNAGSMILYSQGFGVSDRKITMSGEGYFEVAHNEELPFYVTTKDLEVKVLGTKFNFRNYPTDVEAIVTLVEGRVSMKNLVKDQEERFLNPDQRAVLDKTSGEMAFESRNSSNSIEWTHGTLFFDEELLPDIANELERAYNVRISIIGEKLNRMRVYGNFVSNEVSIENILYALSATNQMSYRIDGRDITLYETTK